MVEACEALREKLSEIKGLGPAAQYGLFLADEDPKRGVWLEPGRTLEHYLLRENVSILSSPPLLWRSLNQFLRGSKSASATHLLP